MNFHDVSFEPDKVDLRRLRNAFGRFATGVTVITTLTPAGRPIGLTVNSFSAVSLDPPLVLWSLRRDSPSLQDFLAAGSFAVNVLAADQLGVSRHFAQSRREKFLDHPYVADRHGCPLLEGCLAAFECSTHATLDAGDHVVFIGRVHHARYREGEPLVFSGGHYGTVAPLPPRA
jgi:flavin reductase (DIM6/NTAB) family NADH-FMN oxidoreductase RutF